VKYLFEYLISNQVVETSNLPGARLNQGVTEVSIFRASTNRNASANPMSVISDHVLRHATLGTVEMRC
jgi:hypothetical protein